MRKYGPENFTISVLEECPNEDLNSREVYWIEKYHSREDGYNITPGGGGWTKCDDADILALWDNGFTVAMICEKMGLCKSTVSHR